MHGLLKCACGRHQYNEGDSVTVRDEDGWMTEVHRYEFCLTPHEIPNAELVAKLAGIPVMLVQRGVRPEAPA